MLRVYAPTPAPGHSSPPLLMPPREGGWKGIQGKVTPQVDPHGLLFRRVRVYWPHDLQWFAGRVTKYE